MFEELEYEYNLFLEDMENGKTFCRYMDETDYEDEYSHNEIYEYQYKFLNKIKKYLKENKPNQYIVSCSWCVFVMTVDEAKKRNVWNYEYSIVR